MVYTAAFDVHMTVHHDKFLIINQLDVIISSKLRMYETLVRQTSGNICLWNVGTKRKHKNQTKGIWEEDTKKNLCTH